MFVVSSVLLLHIFFSQFLKYLISFGVIKNGNFIFIFQLFVKVHRTKIEIK